MQLRRKAFGLAALLAASIGAYRYQGTTIRHLVACCLLIGTVVTALPATAAKRVALVIGNSAYQNAARLPNPVNDSRAVADALRRLDFVVIEGVDQDKRGMQRLLNQFSAELQDADAGLFFYAGH